MTKGDVKIIWLVKARENHEIAQNQNPKNISVN